MLAWEESLGNGGARRGHRDFDDFDELDDDEIGPDEESEFAVRYLEDEDEDDDGDAEERKDDELYELEEEPPGGLGGSLQPEEW